MLRLQQGGCHCVLPCAAPDILTALDILTAAAGSLWWLQQLSTAAEVRASGNSKQCLVEGNM